MRQLSFLAQKKMGPEGKYFGFDGLSMLRASISLSQRKGIRRTMNIYITWGYVIAHVSQSLKSPPGVLRSSENPFLLHLREPAEIP